MTHINKSGYLRLFSRHPSHKVLRNSIEVKTPIGLRLGSNTPCKHFCFNSVEGIEASSNKLLMKQRFQNVGVSSPEFFTLNINNAVLNTEEVSFETLGNSLSFPVLAKRTYRSKGVGMIKLDSYDEYMAFIEDKVRGKAIQNRNPYYLEKFYTYSREYRLHISKNGCFYACRKMLKEGTNKRWMRNDSNSVWITEHILTKDVNGDIESYQGENPTFNKPVTWNNIIEDCQKARIALDLDICCFDVKTNREGQWIILESNSAPSFGTVTSLMYTEELKKLIADV